MQSREVLKTEQLPDYGGDVTDGLSISKETLTNLGNDMKDRLDALKGMRERSDWETDKADAFNSYMMIPDQTKSAPYPGYPNLTCPLPRIATDAFHANVMQSLFSRDSKIMIRPDYFIKDYMSTAKRGAKYLSFQLNYECNAYEVMDDWDKKAETFGIGYIEPYYCKEYAYETVKTVETTDEPVIDPATGRVSMQEKKITKTEKKKKCTFDGIRLESLPVDCIYKSPFLRTLKECVKNDMVFKVFKRSWDKIVAQTVTPKSDGDEVEATPKKTYYMKEQVDSLRAFKSRSYFKTYSELEQARASYDGFDAWMDGKIAKEELELAEGYLWYDVDGDKIPEQVKVTFHPETGTVLRVALGPCRIVELQPRPIDERGYGQGIPKMGEPICEEWEAIHNSRVAAGQWENTTFGFYRAGGRLNPQEITIMPGHFYPVDDPREIQFAQTPTVRQSYFNEEQLLMRYWQLLTGQDDNFQGVSAARTTTATDTLNSSQKAALRFGNPFTRIVLAVTELLGHMWDLNRECAPAEKEFYIVEAGATPLFDKVHKKDFNEQLAFRPDVSSVFDEQMLRDSVLLKYRMFMSNPLVINNPGVLYELTTMVDEAVGGQTLSIPKPDQAKTLAPMEEHELFEAGKDAEPQLGEDVEHHLIVHEALIHSDAFKEMDPEAQMKLLIHRDKTKILQQTLQAANLNQSGVYEGQGQPGMPEQPSVNASRNPGQAMNNLKVGESPASMNQNAGGGQ